jgi:hypothetical protein
MNGVLIAQEQDRDTKKVAQLTMSSETEVIFPPHALRSWELPAQEEEARGSTVLWTKEGKQDNKNPDDCIYGFCFESWTVATLAHRLQRPFLSYGLHVQYVEVFRGSLLCTFKEGTQTLYPGDFLYVKAGKVVAFGVLSPDTIGTVLYYR